jgi:hypothetical protein
VKEALRGTIAEIEKELLSLMACGIPQSSNITRRGESLTSLGESIVG